MWCSVTDVLVGLVATHDLRLVDATIAGLRIRIKIFKAQRVSRNNFFCQLGHFLQLLLNESLLKMVLVEAGGLDKLP